MVAQKHNTPHVYRYDLSALSSLISPHPYHIFKYMRRDYELGRAQFGNLTRSVPGFQAKFTRLKPLKYQTRGIPHFTNALYKLKLFK